MVGNPKKIPYFVKMGSATTARCAKHMQAIAGHFSNKDMLFLQNAFTRDVSGEHRVDPVDFR
jgi:hypothetical protein